MQQVLEICKMIFQHYRDMIVWQKSIDLVDLVYELTTLFPPEEKFDLARQMRRAAISIASNIAEGQNRNTNKDFAHFLTMSRGSAAELETQMIICNRRNYLTADQTQQAFKLLDEISRMLNSLINKLSV